MEKYTSKINRRNRIAMTVVWCCLLLAFGLALTALIVEPCKATLVAFGGATLFLFVVVKVACDASNREYKENRKLF